MADTVITRDAFDLACQILGLSPQETTLSGAKEARDRLILGLHPDRGAEDSEANREKMASIQEAYTVIRDCGGARPAAPPPVRGPTPGGFRSVFFTGGGPIGGDFDDIFRALHPERGGTPWGWGRTRSPTQPQPADAVVQVSLFEVLHGGQRTIQVPTYEPCSQPGGGRHPLTCVCGGSNMVPLGFNSHNMNILPGCGLGNSGPAETRLRFAGKGRPLPSGERGDFIISVVWDQKPVPIQVGDQEISVIFNPRGPWLSIQGVLSLDPVQAMMGGFWEVRLPWLSERDPPSRYSIPSLQRLLQDGGEGVLDLLEGQQPIQIPRPKGGSFYTCVDLPVVVRIRWSAPSLTHREKVLLGLLAQERGLPIPNGYPDLPDREQVLQAAGLPPKKATRKAKRTTKKKAPREATDPSVESA